MALWPPPSMMTFDPNPSDEKRAEGTTAMQMSIYSIVFAVAVVFTMSRLYVRAFMVKAFGLDDGFLSVSILLLTGGFIATVIQAYNGLGHHTDILTRDEGYMYRMMAWVVNLLISNLCMGVLKLAIGLNLLRFCKDNVIWPWYKWLVWAVIGVHVIYSCAIFTTAWTHCQPLPRNWDLALKDGQCVTPKVFGQWGMVSCVVNIFTDISYALLPIPIIWRVKLPMRVRMYLIAVLSLGWVAVVIGIIRVNSILSFKVDKYYTMKIGPAFWAFLEVSAGIIATSCVALRPLLAKISRGITTTNAQSRRTPLSGLSGGGGSSSRNMVSSKSRKQFAEIELDETDFEPREKRFDTDTGRGRTTAQVHGRSSNGLTAPWSNLKKEGDATSTFYDHSAQAESGSEEAIMAGKSTRGITRTTNVSVAYGV